MAQYNQTDNKLKPDCQNIIDARVCDLEPTCFYDYSTSVCNYVQSGRNVSSPLPDQSSFKPWQKTPLDKPYAGILGQLAPMPSNVFNFTQATTSFDCIKQCGDRDIDPQTEKNIVRAEGGKFPDSATPVEGPGGGCYEECMFCVEHPGQCEFSMGVREECP